MPLGIERINARQRQPNERICFIKPLEGSDRALAQDFLERIAAICSPIMKKHHLGVMSLEEHAPNLEFVGRNFNAGEVIQLVLKAPFTGHWLPFRYVQMVMMHELAHISHMNHSRAFWKVRNGLVLELKELWGKCYTGDGFWSKGQTLLLGEAYSNTAQGPLDGEMMPKALCGGTYRSSTRKRKRAKGGSNGLSALTNAERKQRRITKKFGRDGVVLGGDDENRIKLEQGKKAKKVKPRVAKSARGRELRAAAALARFDQQQKSEIEVKKDESSSGSETESEFEDDEVGKEALDTDGTRMHDGQGRSLIKVCEEEDTSNEDVQREMEELRAVEGKHALLAVSVKTELSSSQQD